MLEIFLINHSKKLNSFQCTENKYYQAILTRSYERGCGQRCRIAWPVVIKNNYVTFLTNEIFARLVSILKLVIFAIFVFILNGNHFNLILCSKFCIIFCKDGSSITYLFAA